MVCHDLPLSEQAASPFSSCTLAVEEESEQPPVSDSTVQHFLSSELTPETNQIDSAIERRAIVAGPPQEMQSLFWSGCVLFML